MLALPPFDLSEEQSTLTKEELCLKLADLVNSILGDGELQRLEVSWKKGDTFIRMLKRHEDPAREDKLVDYADTIPAPGPADGVSVPSPTV